MRDHPFRYARYTPSSSPVVSADATGYTAYAIETARKLLEDRTILTLDSETDNDATGIKALKTAI